MKAVRRQVEEVQDLQTQVFRSLEAGVQMLHGLNDNAASLDQQMQSSLQLQVLPLFCVHLPLLVLHHHPYTPSSATYGHFSFLSLHCPSLLIASIESALL